MTREGYNKHRKVIEAWAKGAEVEWQSKALTAWLSCNSPTWADRGEYRIKSERKTLAGWMNVYSNDTTGILHDSRDKADRQNIVILTRIACVQVEISYTPGEGLS